MKKYKNWKARVWVEYEFNFKAQNYKKAKDRAREWIFLYGFGKQIKWKNLKIKLDK